MKATFLMIALLLVTNLSHAAVRLKSLAHFAGLQENPLIGYGLVIGLAGTGDSHRNKEVTQAVANLLQSFGVSISPNEINSKNSATVMVTSNLPTYSHQGDKLAVNVASLGDAKSLEGGTLLVTPLKATDNQIYALAQGPISTGGYKYDLYGNVMQKNHPTAGLIPGGAVVEKTIFNDLVSKEGLLILILNRPDFTTAALIERALNKQFNQTIARARSAQEIEIHPPLEFKKQFIHFISKLENIVIKPDNLATVVINERTGVVVAGAEVKIDAVTISHGNLQIAIATRYEVSQPAWLSDASREIQTAVTPQTSIRVQEPPANSIHLQEGASVAELISALRKVGTSTRDLIVILESLERAGALHAELIFQ